VIICQDLSLEMNENKINSWTEFVMTQVSKYHRCYNQLIQEVNDPAAQGYKEKDVTGPLIIHAFTKTDKIPELS
jgi:hypothetical protein